MTEKIASATCSWLRDRTAATRATSASIESPSAISPASARSPAWASARRRGNRCDIRRRQKYTPRSTMTVTETTERPTRSHSTQPAPINVKESNLSAIILNSPFAQSVSRNHLHGPDQPPDAAAAVACDDPHLHRPGFCGRGPVHVWLGGGGAQRIELAAGRVEAPGDLVVVAAGQEAHLRAGAHGAGAVGRKLAAVRLEREDDRIARGTGVRGRPHGQRREPVQRLPAAPGPETAP